MVVRRFSNTLRDSVFSQMTWAIAALGLDAWFRARISPMELTYLPTGQRIVFRGADDPLKLKGVKFVRGYAVVVWFEELDQFDGIDAVRSILNSLRCGGDDFWIFYSYNPPRTLWSWVNREGLERERRADTLVRQSESESPPFPLTHRVPFGHDAVNGEGGHGMGHPSPKYSAEFKQQAARPYRERGGTCAETAREPGVDPGSLPWPGEEGRRRAGAGRGQPLPDGGAAPQAGARERTAEEGGRDAFESERLPRRQAAVGSRAEGARFAFAKADEAPGGLRDVLGAQGDPAGLLRVAIPRPRRARRGGRRAGVGDRGGPRRRPRRLRRPEGLRRARAVRRARPRASARRASCARAAGPAPPGAAPGARGARPNRPPRRPTPRPTWCAGSSARTAPTGRGSPTSPASARARGGPTPPRPWAYGPAGSSDGRRPRAWPPGSPMTRPRWRWPAGARRSGRAHHPGHGSQHVSPQLGGTVRGAGVAPPMGSISSPRDDAAMGSLDGRPSRPSARTPARSGRAIGRRWRYSTTPSASTTASGSTRRRDTSVPRSWSRPTCPGDCRRPMAA